MMPKTDPRFQSIYYGFAKVELRNMNDDEWNYFKSLTDRNFKVKNMLMNH